MEKKYYSFDSTKYLVTLAVTPDLFSKAIDDGDFSADSFRHIIPKLMLGTYPDNLIFPVEFTEKNGKKLRDVIEMRWSFAFLISTRIKELFEENGITGWKPYDVVVKRKNGEIIPGYHGFSVLGRYPELLPASGDLVPDFYHPECLGLGIVCSQRVVDLLRKYKIRDFDITSRFINEQGEEIRYERVKI